MRVDSTSGDAARSTTNLSFMGLIEAVRDGDQAAAARLVEQFEPQILRFIRFRLSDPRLRCVLDSLDIYQCVLMKLFDNLSRGEWTLTHPAQLVRLMQTIARNECIDQVRRQRARPRAASSGEGALAAHADSNASPSSIAARHELWNEIRKRLTPDEQDLMDQRLVTNAEWADIAQSVGEQPDALRKRLTRGLDRAARELGIDEGLLNGRG
jgi:RNA polymerase sigma-70 factor (ECF subfamily)